MPNKTPSELPIMMKTANCRSFLNRLSATLCLVYTLLITASVNVWSVVPEPQVSESLDAADQAAQYEAWANSVWDKMRPQTGEVQLLGDVATLNVPPEFYYLPPEDAKTVLEEIWGNPPSSQRNLGMLFPASATPFDQHSWGVTINYVEDGFIEDDDADDIDYSDMLNDLKADVKEENKYRIEQGFGSINLIGWAAPPFYDQEQKKLHWAKEFQFGDAETNTLNYNIRVLGRRGYLLLNFVATMDQLPEIEANIPTVLNIAEFDDGNRYADFDPDVDKVAAYGIGALVAGKLMAKAGILATALLALKKFWVLIFVALSGIWKLITRGKRGE